MSKEGRRLVKVAEISDMLKSRRRHQKMTILRIEEATRRASRWA